MHYLKAKQLEIIMDLHPQVHISQILCIQLFKNQGSILKIFEDIRHKC